MMKDPKTRIHFILSHTRFASNLGAAVRVMKNMGFEQLILVRPECEVGAEARTLAMKGADILDRARFLPSLEAVVESLDILVGSSARFGSESPKWIAPRTMAAEVVAAFSDSEIGIAFGSESNGLTKDETRICDWFLQIPTAPNHGVLNLAQAVGIVAYEIHLNLSTREVRPRISASQDSLEALLQEVERKLAGRGPAGATIPIQRIMGRLRRIAARSQLQPEDIRMLRALL